MPVAALADRFREQNAWGIGRRASEVQGVRVRIGVAMMSFK